MSKLDEALKSFRVGEVNKLLSDPQGLITDNTLNIAILSGHHPFVSRLLELGAQPNDDTITCALFSGQPHFIVTKLLDNGAKTITAKEHVEYSGMHHPVRSRIKEERVSNLSVKSADALEYAETRLSGLKEKYGPFNGQKREMEREMEREQREMKQSKGGFFDKGQSLEDSKHKSVEDGSSFEPK